MPRLASISSITRKLREKRKHGHTQWADDLGGKAMPTIRRARRGHSPSKPPFSNLTMPCRVRPESWSKMPEFGLLADACCLLPKHGMALEADHAAKIAGRAQKNRLSQGNGHGSSDAGSMRLLTVAVCALSSIRRSCAQVPLAGARNSASNISGRHRFAQQVTGRSIDSNQGDLFSLGCSGLRISWCHGLSWWR